jgi:hypothetical protein
MRRIAPIFFLASAIGAWLTPSGRHVHPSAYFLIFSRYPTSPAVADTTSESSGSILFKDAIFLALPKALQTVSD